MDSKLVALILVVAASGCAHSGGQDLNPGTSSGSGTGLEIAEFRITDNTLNPGQEARVVLQLKNHHSHEVEFDDISLYNMGFMQIDGENSMDARCGQNSIKGALEDFTPAMECTWTVVAPEDTSGFRSRAITVNLNLAYRSRLSNGQNPFKLHFREMNNIENRNEVSQTYSNSEVKMTVTTESPATVDEGSIIDLQMQPIGSGRVASDYSMEYSPSQVLEDCPSETESITGERTRFSCKVVPGTGSSTTRNLVFSTSYKYVKSPSLDIEVIKP